MADDMRYKHVSVEPSTPSVNMMLPTATRCLQISVDIWHQLFHWRPGCGNSAAAFWHQWQIRIERIKRRLLSMGQTDGQTDRLPTIT